MVDRLAAMHEQGSLPARWAASLPWLAVVPQAASASAARYAPLQAARASWAFYGLARYIMNSGSGLATW